MEFPNSFQKYAITCDKNAFHWTIRGSDGLVFVGVIGGGRYSMFGDGVRDFQMYDFREDGPRHNMTAEEITTYIQLHMNHENIHIDI